MIVEPQTDPARVAELLAVFRLATDQQQYFRQQVQAAGVKRALMALELHEQQHLTTGEIAELLQMTRSRVDQLYTLARKHRGAAQAERPSVPAAAAYCLCGGRTTVLSSSQEAADADVAAFWEQHAGDGHGPTSPRRAAGARRRAELALQAEAGR